MIYVLIKKGRFLFLDINADYSERYDAWYFNKSSILLSIGWQLERNSTFDNRYADFDYCAKKYDASSYQVIRCLEGFGISELEEMEREVLKYIFNTDGKDVFI